MACAWHPSPEFAAGDRGDCARSSGLAGIDEAMPSSAVNTPFLLDGAVGHIARNARALRPFSPLFFSATEVAGQFQLRACSSSRQPGSAEITRSKIISRRETLPDECSQRVLSRRECDAGRTSSLHAISRAAFIISLSNAVRVASRRGTGTGIALAGPGFRGTTCPVAQALKAPMPRSNGRL